MPRSELNLLLVRLCLVSCFLKLGAGARHGAGNVELVKPASLGEDGKTSLGELLRWVGERERRGRSNVDISRGEVEVFIEKSRVDVFEEVDVDDVIEVSDCVEEDVRTRRMRAKGILSVCCEEPRVLRDWSCLRAFALRDLRDYCAVTLIAVV